MTGKEWLERLSTVVVTGCAVIVTVTLVRGQAGTAQAEFQPSRMRQVDNWEEVAAAGRRIGRADADITVVEFGDFQCPVCASFNRAVLAALRSDYPDQVAIVFRHWPLSIHEHAYGAAQAAECAAEQGRFEAMHDMLYAYQDSLGLVSPEVLADRAGVADLAEFSRCIADGRGTDRIEADIQAAADLGATGTPTILLNGLYISGAPDSVRFMQLVKKLLKERH
ncbi:MAG: thioredoxin domain-containing protein [Gemmatimonadetes bacterium]|nr:thioredoxin domain-containing protein [Gemmatimonadota bacterium]